MEENFVDEIEQFSAKLERELIKRKRELTNVWFFAAQEENELKRNSLLRNNVLIIYAHWEGFVKSASVRYLDFVNKQKQPCQKLKPNFRALHAQKKFCSSNSGSDWNRFLSLVEDSYMEAFKVKSRKVVDTGSNLKSEVFCKIISTIGLNDFTLTLREIAILDRGLMKDRNAIAHGELIEVKIKVVERYHNMILVLLEKYKDSLIASIESESYFMDEINAGLENDPH